VGGELGGIGWGEVERRVGGYFGDASFVGKNAGKASGERFDDGEAKGFLPSGRGDKEGGVAVFAGDLVTGDAGNEFDAVAEGGGEFAKMAFVGRERIVRVEVLGADDANLKAAVGGGDGGGGFEEEVGAFDVHDAAEEEDDGVAGGGGRWGGEAVGVDAIEDDFYFGGAGGEGGALGDVFCDVIGDADDDVGVVEDPADFARGVAVEELVVDVEGEAGVGHAAAEEGHGGGGVVDENGAVEGGAEGVGDVGVEAGGEGAAEGDAGAGGFEEAFVAGGECGGEIGFEDGADGVGGVAFGGAAGDDNGGGVALGGVGAGEFVDDGHDGGAGGGGVVIARGGDVGEVHGGVGGGGHGGGGAFGGEGHLAAHAIKSRVGAAGCLAVFSFMICS
jgi:hypothetical protein